MSRCYSCDKNIDGHINLCVCPDEEGENFLGYVGEDQNGHLIYMNEGGPYTTIKQAKRFSRCKTIRELHIGPIVDD